MDVSRVYITYIPGFSGLHYLYYLFLVSRVYITYIPARTKTPLPSHGQHGSSEIQMDAFRIDVTGMSARTKTTLFAP